MSRKTLYAALALIALGLALLPVAALAQAPEEPVDPAPALTVSAPPSEPITITPEPVGGESPRGVPAAGPALVAAPQDDAIVLAELALTGATTGDLWLVFGPLVALAVMALRSGWVRRRLPARWGKALDHPLVAFSLPFLAAEGAGLAVAKAAGALTAKTAAAITVAALKVASAAVTSYVGGKKMGEYRRERRKRKASAQATTSAPSS